MKVHTRPMRTEQEQADMDAALDTLIFMALRNVLAERERKAAVRRGFEARGENSTESMALSITGA